MNHERSCRAHTWTNHVRGVLFSTTGLARLSVLGMAASLALAPAAHAQDLPTGGTVTAGQASISENPANLTITQTSQNTAINWQTFNIGAGNTVQFFQPNSSSVALNRVVSADASAIFGTLTANGHVFLINPNGVLFGRDARVDVGGLVASTLDVSDPNFMAGDYRFSGESRASVINRGSINADGGHVALLGANVSNDGLIQANMGTVALAVGEAITLDVAGDGLLNVAIDKGAVGALVENGGLLRANGGKVLMTAQAAGELLHTAVNNTGVIEAQTLANHNGTIMLLGDMQSGTMNVAGRLDASAPHGGNGGFIETSAAHVHISDDVRVTTAAPYGETGTWLIDPQDFTVAETGGNISGATLSAQLVTNNVIISTFSEPGNSLPGNGDIHINDAIAWTASGGATTLTLNAHRDININRAITATNGNLVACCGRDINVRAPITTTNGSVLLNAGQNVNVFHAITTTDGNIALCAGHDIHIDGKVTLTRGTTIPAQSNGLPVGLTLIAGAAGTGPGADQGTIIFAPLSPPITVTKAPVTINYNPVNYNSPRNFAPHFVLTEGATVTARMMLYPNATKVEDGTTEANLEGFNTTATSGMPTDVDLVAGPGAIATFDSAEPGQAIGISYDGYSLAGANADRYALAGFCCTTSAGSRTTGTITPSQATPPPPPPAPPPPVVTPPVVTPPVVTPPVVTPPVMTPPVVTPPVVTPPVVTPPVSGLPGVLLPVVPPVTTPPLAIGPVPATAVVVIGGGVHMPKIDVASVPTEEERPVRRTGNAPGPKAFLPAKPALPKPIVPVYPRKQARH